MSPTQSCAPPWLLLHGTLGVPASWDDVLARTPDDLRRRARCLTLPGHGSGALGRCALRFVQAARRMWRQVPYPGPVLLGGYSLGGRLALAMALQRPERVAGLLLVGAHLGIAGRDARAERRAGDRAWAAQLRSAGTAAFLSAWRAQKLFETQAALPSEVLARQENLSLQHDCAALARAIERLSPGDMPNFAPRVGQLGCPVRWLAGGRDAKYAREAVRGAGLCAQGSHHIVEGAGHNVLLEAPEAMAEELRAFAWRKTTKGAPA